jgi:hypothetical protein
MTRPRAHIESTLRHESCKFGAWIEIGTLPDIRACNHSHKQNVNYYPHQLKPAECLACGYYDKIIPSDAGGVK